jgi:hypothetical protein
LSSGANPYIARISQFNGYYQAFISGAISRPTTTCTESDGKDIYRADTCLQAWADGVLDPTNGIITSLENIHSVLAEEPSSIKACMAVDPPGVNSTDTVTLPFY